MMDVIWSEATEDGFTTFSAHDLTGQLIEERAAVHNEGYLHSIAANGATIVYATYNGVYVSKSLDSFVSLNSFFTEHDGTMWFGSGTNETLPASITYTNGKFRARLSFTEIYDDGNISVYHDIYCTSVDGYNWVRDGIFALDGVPYLGFVDSVYYEEISGKYFLLTNVGDGFRSVKITSDFSTYIDAVLPFGQYTNSLVIYGGFIYWLEYYYASPFYRVKQVVKLDANLQVVATYPILLPSGVTLTHNYWYYGGYLDQFGVFYCEIEQNDDYNSHAIYKVVNERFERVQELSGCLSTQGFVIANNRNDYILVDGQRVCVSGLTGKEDCGVYQNVITILGPGTTTTEFTLPPNTGRFTIASGYLTENEFWTEEDQCVEVTYEY